MCKQLTWSLEPLKCYGSFWAWNLWNSSYSMDQVNIVKTNNDAKTIRTEWLEHELHEGPKCAKHWRSTIFNFKFLEQRFENGELWKNPGKCVELKHEIWT